MNVHSSLPLIVIAAVTAHSFMEKYETIIPWLICIRHSYSFADEIRRLRILFASQCYPPVITVYHHSHRAYLSISIRICFCAYVC